LTTFIDYDDLVVVPYDADAHSEQLSEWLIDWQLKPEDILPLLPSTGFIIDGIAAVFIYETNSKVCYIDGFIRHRHSKVYCLDKLIDFAVNYAKKKGFVKMLAQTKLQSVINRARKFDFVSQGEYSVLSRSL
jgi:hypothetical protein